MATWQKTASNAIRDEKIVMAVLRGEKQDKVAKRFGVTDGRVNQIFADWCRTKECKSLSIENGKVKRT